MTKDKQNQEKKRWSEIRKNIEEAHPIFEPKEGKEKHIHKFRQANLFSYPIFEDGKEVWVCEDLNCSARELRESKKAEELYQEGKEMKLIGYNCKKCRGKNFRESEGIITHACEGFAEPVLAPESRGDWRERFREKFVRTSYPFLGGQHDNFKEIDVPTEIFEMELIERIEDFIQSELTLAHTEGIEEGKKETWREILESLELGDVKTIYSQTKETKNNE